MANPEWLTIQNRHAKEVNNLDEQITTLKKQLAKHGGHTAECWINTLETPGEEHPCTCGWAEIVKGQDK